MAPGQYGNVHHTRLYSIADLERKPDATEFSLCVRRCSYIDDFNGDDWPDLLWRNSRNGSNCVWYLNGTRLVGSGAILPDQTIDDPLSNARLTTEQLKISKLGALILFTSQGAVMMEEG